MRAGPVKGRRRSPPAAFRWDAEAFSLWGFLAA
jgi:hypothetical protein